MAAAGDACPNQERERRKNQCASRTQGYQRKRSWPHQANGWGRRKGNGKKENGKIKCRFRNEPGVALLKEALLDTKDGGGDTRNPLRKRIEYNPLKQNNRGFDANRREDSELASRDGVEKASFVDGETAGCR